MSSHADVDRLRHCRKAGSRKSRNVKTRVRLRKAAACGLGEVEAAGGAAANVQAGRKAVHDRQVDILEAALNFHGFTKGARHRRSAFAESDDRRLRSEEHTSELQSLMRISYAVFCLKKKKTNKTKISTHNLKYIHRPYRNDVK